MGQPKEIYEKNEEEEIGGDMNVEKDEEDEELELVEKELFEDDFVRDTPLEEG